MEQMRLTNSDLAIIYLALGKRIPVYDGMPEHERRCTELRDWFADVQKQGVAAVVLAADADALAEVLAMSGIDEYMPTDAEWAAHPLAKFAATDYDGDLFLYAEEPELGEDAWFGGDDNNLGEWLRYTTPPGELLDDTLRTRPAHL